MSGISEYRRVNYYELCRLCTGSGGTKMHIFREEGRRRTLQQKIQTCLPLSVKEDDSLPKIICSGCVEKLEGYFNFRESCVNAEAMLESYFSSLCFNEESFREGKFPVYIKDDKKKEAPTKRKDQQEDNIPSTLQILANSEGSRISQFKVQVQGGVPSLVPAFPPTAINSSHNTEKIARNDGQAQTQTENLPNLNNVQTVSTTPMVTAVTVHPQDLFSVHDGSRTAAVGGTIALPTGGHIRLDPEQLSQLLVTGSSLQFTVKTDQQLPLQQPQQKTKVGLKSDLNMKYDHEESQIKRVVEGEDLEGEEGEVEADEGNIEEAGGGEEGELKGDHMITGGQDGDGTNGEASAFPCDVCSKPFRRKEHLLQHKKSHSGHRPFGCILCGKAFSRKEHLLRHRVSHTGLKKFTCDICQKSFSRKDNLHKHKKIHGIATGPYVCELCGKSFQVRHYYTQHKSHHAHDNNTVKSNENASNEAASDKTNATSSASALNPLPYQCDMCVKSFSTPSLLYSHKQRHRGKALSKQGVQRVVTQTPQVQPVQQPQQPPQQATILTGFPINTGLTTINPHALLAAAPNIVYL